MDMYFAVLPVWCTVQNQNIDVVIKPECNTQMGKVITKLTRDTCE